MDRTRLEELLDNFANIYVLVVGDFFLDEYLLLDRTLSETSLETGLEAYQVVAVRTSPGAAGTVCSNLRALGTGVSALGVVGQDGKAFELKRGLAERGVTIDPLIAQPDLFTPTYTKPMMREPDGRQHELQRLDIKNRQPMPASVEAAIIDKLRTLVPQVDGVIVADQVPEANCGTVTDKVCAEIGALAKEHPDVLFAADSRKRIGRFQHVIIKPNAFEAVAAVRSECPDEISVDLARECGSVLYQRSGKPVFLTLGDQGLFVFTSTGCEHIPAVAVDGEIDIVGAGDSFMAAAMSALCSGASPREAAFLGNLVASITIQQIGTTGTATPSQVRRQFAQTVHD
ncbi:MAG: PfkB family carbohydrate kinase [Anaerolineae bacterium]|jgi:rfaE bifunctional protein kinase chain/domain